MSDASDAARAPWHADLLVRTSAGAAAVPLGLFYLIVRPENVFYQPFSATGWALALVAAFVPLLLGRPEFLRSALAMVVGAAVVNTVFIFIVGPGNLWPIAIGLGTGSAVVPIAAGSLAGSLVAGATGVSGRRTAG